MPHTYTVGEHTQAISLYRACALSFYLHSQRHGGEGDYKRRQHSFVFFSFTHSSSASHACFVYGRVIFFSLPALFFGLTKVLNELNMCNPYTKICTFDFLQIDPCVCVQCNILPCPVRSATMQREQSKTQKQWNIIIIMAENVDGTNIMNLTWRPFIPHTQHTTYSIRMRVRAI